MASPMIYLAYFALLLSATAQAEASSSSIEEEMVDGVQMEKQELNECFFYTNHGKKNGRCILVWGKTPMCQTANQEFMYPSYKCLAYYRKMNEGVNPTIYEKQ